MQTETKRTRRLWNPNGSERAAPGRRSKSSAMLVGALAVLLPGVVQAGNWGQQNWGELTWGVGGPLPEVPGLGPLGTLVLLGLLMALSLFLLRRRSHVVVRIAVPLAAFVPFAAYAAQISMPNTFTNGTTADADQVNANFDTLTVESNAQDIRIDNNAAAIAAIPDVAAHVADPSAHHLKTTSFGELTDSIANGQIPSLITRDSEVFGIVLAGDGPGSGLNADLLDGLSSGSYATDAEVFGLVLGADGPGSGLNADFLDNLSSSSFLRSNASDTFTTGTMTFSPGTVVNLNGTVSIGASSGTDDDSLYFDATSERLYWDDDETRFRMTDALGLEGPLSVGSSTSPSQAYNYMQTSGTPVPRGPQMQNSGDLYIQFDLEIGNNLYLDRVVYMNAETDTGFDADQIIYFYEAGSTVGEDFRWDDADDRFEFSDNAAFENAILVGHRDGTYAYNRMATTSTPVPASGLMNTEDDLFVGDDIETGGDIYVDGLQISTPRVVIRSGSDLSEGFEVRDPSSSGGEEIEPGTVVCIDPAHPGALRTCAGAYDRTVAGIVSGAGGIETGLMMGQEGSIASGDHPVALTGRVYVKAQTGAEPIRPGDLLTTSDMPGYAMRVDDYGRSPGAVLGKAMTALEEGEGLVLVLVALQ